MRILVACEFSQIVTKAFRDKGHEAYSCDLIPTEGNPEWHIQGNVLKYISDNWDMMIAFPPCTYLCNSGVRWLYERPDRWDLMKDACIFFNRLLDANINYIAVENPIQHSWARQLIRPCDQIIQPYYFGDKERKATCLWLKNLPPLIAQFSGGEDIKQSIFHTPPGKERWRKRSKTFNGVARAMAEQWSNLRDTRS